MNKKVNYRSIKMALLISFLSMCIAQAGLILGGCGSGFNGSNNTSNIGRGTNGEIAYYISPNGSDSNSGTSPSSPWKTFAYAISQLKPGDTLVLMSGTYNSSNSGYPYINCSSNAPNGTPTQPITIMAQYERQAFISGDGYRPFLLYNCSYWNVQGLHIRNIDNKYAYGGTGEGGTVLEIIGGNHITVKRGLFTNNNRYKNASCVLLLDVSNSLLEENEVYYCHRNVFSLGASSTTMTAVNNEFRRNYINSRGYADLSDGRGSGDPTRGDGGYTLYPAAGNTYENNISEGNADGFEIESTLPSDNNVFLGNIAIGNGFGMLMTARGSSDAQMPHNNVVKNYVSVNSNYAGVYARSNKNTQCINCSFFGGGMGFLADKNGTYPGDGVYSVFVTNSLAVNAQQYGFYITNQNSWGVNYTDSYNNAINYSPNNSGVTNSITTSPITGMASGNQVGTGSGQCVVYIPPENTNLKGKGNGGADIGANIIYRYENGVPTNQKLWDQTTGQFPCGATVAGVNDDPNGSTIDTQACINVHKRLNVGVNGCTIP